MSSETFIMLFAAGLAVAGILVSAILRWVAGKTGELAEHALGAENVSRIRKVARFIIGPAPVESDGDNHLTQEPSTRRWFSDIGLPYGDEVIKHSNEVRKGIEDWDN